MSDALNYLMQARPGAMKSYFSFVKQSGEHLDPKTRAIISVITKVDKQTEKGFRQYLSRALQCGVTADEILDAMLVAFPTLGLTKIVWAMELLLEMNLPEFDLDNLGKEGCWQEICDKSELQQNTSAYIKVHDRCFFIYMDESDIYVYDSHCPHQGTDIPESGLSGNNIECPKHKWKFDIRSGQCIEPGDLPLKRIKHKIENNLLMGYW